MHCAERVGAQRHRTDDLAGPHVDLDPPTRPAIAMEFDAGRARTGNVDERLAVRPRRGRDQWRPRARPAPRAPRPSPRRAGPRTRAARRRRPFRSPRPGSMSALGPPVVRGRPNAPCARHGRARSRRDGVRRRGADAWARGAPRLHAATARGRLRRSASASFRASVRHRAAALAPERAAVRQRRGRDAAGAGPTRVRLDVRRLEPGCLESEGPVTVGHLDRMRQRHRAVPALHAATPGPGGAQARGERLRRRPAGRGHRAAPSRQRSPRRRGPPRGPNSETPALRPGLATPPAAGSEVRPRPASRHRRRPAHCRRRRRWTANRCTGTGVRAGRLDVAARRRPPRSRPFERGKPKDDAGRAEAALARPVLDECGGPALAQLLRCSLERGDPAPGDAPDGRHAGDAGRPVDPDRAASALALRAAAVLDGATAEFFSQRIEKADPVVDRHLVTVEDERDRSGRGRAEARAPFGSGAGSAQRAGRPKLS